MSSAAAADQFDLDQVQEWGETALITLTQLWRQLPRVDTEAATKLSDQVVEARTAIEHLVRAACAAHRMTLDQTADRLYEPLPFGTGAPRSRSAAQLTAANDPNARGVSTFSNTSFQSGNNHNNNNKHQSRSRSGNAGSKNNKIKQFGDEGAVPHFESGGDDDDDEDDDEDDTNGTSSEGQHYSPADAIRAAALGHITSGDNSPSRGGGNKKRNNNNNNNDPYDEYDADSPERKLFKMEIRSSGVPSIIFDAPSGSDLADNLSTRGRTPLARLALMVQFAERREQMWKNHAKFLEDKNDREQLEESETQTRYAISSANSTDREKFISEFLNVIPQLLTTEITNAAAIAIASANSSTKKKSGKLTEEEIQRKNSIVAEIRQTLLANSPQRSSSSQLQSLANHNNNNSNKPQTEEEKFKHLHDKVEILHIERNHLIEEMSVLSSEVTRLARDNSDLQKKANDLPPGISPEMMQLTEELAELRKQIVHQTERSRSLSRTGSPAIEGGYYVPPQGRQDSTTISSQKKNREQQDEEEEQQEEEEQSTSVSETASQVSEEENSPKRKITSVADAVKMLIERERKKNSNSSSSKKNGSPSSKMEQNSRKNNNNNNSRSNSAQFNGNNSDAEFYANQKKANAARGAAGKMGTSGDDSLVPMQVVRASKTYFNNKETNNNNNKKRKSPKRATPKNGTTPKETHLDSSSKNPNSVYADDDAENNNNNNNEKDDGFADIEERNREVLKKLKEEAARRREKQNLNNAAMSASVRSTRSNSPYHKEGDVVSRSIAYLQKQQQVEDAARRQKRVCYAFGTPVKEPIAPPTGKRPAFSKYYQEDPIVARARSTSPEKKNNNNNNTKKLDNRERNDEHDEDEGFDQQTSTSSKSPRKSLGYLKWEYRRQKSLSPPATANNRRGSNSSSKQHQVGEGNKTPPTPSLNLVTSGGNVVRLENEDDEDLDQQQQINNNKNKRNSISSQQKQQIAVRSAGNVAQVAASSSASSKKPPSSSSSTLSGKKAIPPPPSSSSHKKSTTALQDLANENEDESPLRNVLVESQIRVIEQEERTRRQEIFMEAATYFMESGSLMEKDCIDWLGAMKELRELGQQHETDEAKKKERK